MSSSSLRLDPRTRLALLVLLSAAHAKADGITLVLLTTISVMLAFAYPAAFRRGWRVVALTAIFLTFIAFIVATFDRSSSMSLLGLDLVRWISLATTTVILALTLNVLEAVTALAFFRVPVKLALACGVGLRFLPVVTEEVQRIYMMQRQSGIGFSGKAATRLGLAVILNRITTPLLIGLIRRVDALIISTGVQMLEQRIRLYQWRAFRPFDFAVIIGATALAVACMIS